jgi:hypothetical protein
MAATIPSYDGDPIYIPILKTFLSIGSFVVFEEQVAGSSGGTENELPAVGRIVMQINRENLMINVFHPIKKQPWADSIILISDGLASHAPEVVQSSTITKVPITSVIEIAFIFTKERVNQIGISLEGMAHTYVCRFNSDQTPIQDSASPFFSFASQSFDHSLLDSCYNSRVWESLESVRDVIYSKMNSMSERQGNHCKMTVKIILSHEGWSYIRRNLERRGMESRIFVCRSIRSRLVGALTSVSHRIERPAEFFRFETEEQLAILRLIFGSNCTYGKRQRRARLASEKHIIVNDSINAVNASSELEEVPFSRRTVRDGLDLLYDTVELTVVMRYSKLIYTTSTTANSNSTPIDTLPVHLQSVLKKSNHHGRTVPNDDQSINISIDSLFEWRDGNIYSIVSTRNNNIIAECIAPRCNRSLLLETNNIELVQDAIARYN